MQEIGKLVGRVAEFASETSEVVPPKQLEGLRERCERILFLGSDPKLTEVAPDVVQLQWRTRCARIHQHVEDAFRELRRYIHPLSKQDVREKSLGIIRFHIAIAYDDAKGLAREMERDFQLARAGRRLGVPPDEEVCALVLDRAQKLIALTSWCQQAEAKNEKGWKVSAFAAAATSFSIVGAVRSQSRFVGPEYQRHPMAFVGVVTGTRSDMELQDWNDKANRSKDEVLDALARAAKELRRSKLRQQIPFDFTAPEPASSEADQTEGG